MKSCIFCQIIGGKIPGKFVYQDDIFVVINDIHPQAPVHMLVIPKKHVDDFVDADAILLKNMMQLIKKMINDHKVTRYRLINNGGGAAYIDHVHVHILGSVAKDRNL